MSLPNFRADAEAHETMKATYGRTKQMKLLSQKIDALLLADGEAKFGTTVICGDPGIGKSRLLMEAGKYSRGLDKPVGQRP